MRAQIIRFLEETWSENEPISITQSAKAFKTVMNVFDFNFSQGEKIVEILGHDTYCCIRVLDIQNIECKDNGETLKIICDDYSLEIRRVS